MLVLPGLWQSKTYSTSWAWVSYSIASRATVMLGQSLGSFQRRSLS